MRHKNQIRFGIVIILFGLILLISNITGIDLWSYVWPLLLVGLGIWMIHQPQRFRGNSEMQFRFLGWMDYPDGWSLKNENIFSFIGEMHLDLSKAVIPAGETKIVLHGFVADIDVTVPADVGIKVKSNAFVTSAYAFGYKQDYFLTQYDIKSENYAEAEQKIALDLGFFVTDFHLTHLDR
jgi:predicted membrane protein